MTKIVTNADYNLLMEGIADNIKQEDGDDMSFTVFHGAVDAVISKNIDDLLLNKVRPGLSPAGFRKHLANKYNISIGDSVLSKVRTIHSVRERGDGTPKPRITPGLLLAFAEYTQTPAEEFLIPDRFTKEALKHHENQPPPLMPFLKSIIGENTGYFYNFLEKNNFGEHAVSYLFEDAVIGAKRTFSVYYLPSESRRNEVSAMNCGSLNLTVDCDGCCRAALTIPWDENGMDATFEGFAVIVSNNTQASGIYFFMLRTGGGRTNAEFVVFNFRLDRHNWTTKTAQVLTIKTVDSSPVVMRMVVAKGEVERPDRLEKFLAGGLMFSASRRVFTLPKNQIEYLRDYLSGNEPKPGNEQLWDEILNLLNTYVEALTERTNTEYRNKVLEAVNRYINDDIEHAHIQTSRLSDAGVLYPEARDLLLLIVSWFRRKSSSSTSFFEVSTETDEHAEFLHKQACIAQPNQT